MVPPELQEPTGFGQAQIEGEGVASGDEEPGSEVDSDDGVVV